ncbi:MAG: acyl-ACP thioesterase domain-containing protein [Actinomycetota bacterium]
MAVDAAVEIVDEPTEGRVFRSEGRVRLGDVTPSGRLRLDALARYLQDVANDDAVDAQLPGAMFWVVRRTLVEVHRSPVLREAFELRTFCGGIGSRWAERRTSLIGADGGRVECSVLWVCVDEASMRPARVPPEFSEHYGAAARDRKVRARLQLPDPPDGAPRSTWPMRAVDLDVLGHMNNAAYWAPVEEEIARRGMRRRVRAELEYLSGIEPGEQVTVETCDHDGGFRLWLRSGTEVEARAQVVERVEPAALSSDRA